MLFVYIYIYIYIYIYVHDILTVQSYVLCLNACMKGVLVSSFPPTLPHSSLPLSLPHSHLAFLSLSLVSPSLVSPSLSLSHSLLPPPLFLLPLPLSLTLSLSPSLLPSLSPSLSHFPCFPVYLCMYYIHVCVHVYIFMKGYKVHCTYV